MYGLWFKNGKIFNLKQLKKNFDFDSAEMYFLGGGLSRWLKQCGETELAGKVDAIDVDSDVPLQLSRIFGIAPPQFRPAFSSVSNIECAPINTAGSFEMQTSFPESPANSFEWQAASYLSLMTSFETSEVVNSSFYQNSFVTTSFHQHEYEYENNTSFALTSFSTGSFGYLKNFEQFETGSFNFGSFNLNLTAGSFAGSSYTDMLNLNVRDNEPLSSPLHGVQLSPQEKMKMNISSCPLNRYGYGLHLI